MQALAPLPLVIRDVDNGGMDEVSDIRFTADAMRLLRYAEYVASAGRSESCSDVVEPEHLLVAILRAQTKATYLLAQMHVDPEEIVDDLLRVMESHDG